MADEQQEVQPWRQYEVAVSAFISALDPSARVTHNAKTPDGQTGAPRQRDVWIEGRLCKLFPIRVLVSCKRYGRVLNEGDIDHFLGELITSKADKGVIYSFEGYNDLAIRKAKDLGIECLKLYQDQPPDIPEVLIVPHSYCCYPRFHLSVVWMRGSQKGLRTWNDLFDMPSGSSDPDMIVIDFIHSVLSENQEKVAEKLPGNGFLPIDWLYECTYADLDDEECQIRLRIAETWDIYEAKLSAYNVNGTYSFTEKQFFGSIAGPSIDTWSSDPGPGWSKCEKRPPIHASHMSLSFMLGDIRQALRQIMGSKELKAESDEP